MGQRLPLLVLALLAVAMLSALPSALQASASVSNAVAPGPDGISAITLPTGTLSDDTDYLAACPGGLSTCTAPASTAWADTIFSLTYTGTVSVTITDRGYVGDYYSLYYTTDPTGMSGWTLVGTTGQVDTGSQLTAPTFDSVWTGTGTQYSSTTFNVPASGTTLFAVRDVLFDTMVSLLGSSCGGSSLIQNGCSATGISVSSGWSPAGYFVSFAAAGSSGCLTGGATSWPTVAFSDGSSADVGVTGGVLTTPGVCPTMKIEGLFGTNPAPATPGVTSPNYYDLSIQGLSAGTASLCLTTPLAQPGEGMLYWNGASWVSASSVTDGGGKVCGDIPVTALDTAGTPVVIGSLPAPVSAPEFGAPTLLAAAMGLVVVALVTRIRPITRR